MQTDVRISNSMKEEIAVLDNQVRSLPAMRGARHLITVTSSWPGCVRLLPNG